MPVQRKSIQTNPPIVSCDVCGRTLLRGEHADVFLHGGARRMVCELCTARAAHEGWIREGLDGATVRAQADGRRRGSLLARLRARRAEHAAARHAAPPEPLAAPPAPLYDPDDDEAWDLDDEPVLGPAPEPEPVAEPEPAPEREPSRRSSGLLRRRGRGARASEPAREQRTVHAVPTNADLKMARALELFNGSPHRRTVSGVARSLGAPLVAVRPSETEGSVVTIVVGWELSWYRYEVDLADEDAGVRVAGQGAELDELEAAEQVPNAAADDTGALHLVATHA